jgi:TRAP transporter TAXI family solute receptor
MTAGVSVVATERGRRIALAGTLGLSLLSIQCARNTVSLPPIDRASFKKCSDIVPSNKPVKYLATASSSGAYVLLGDAIAKVASDNPDTRLEVCTSDGSGENLKLLEQGTVQFALAQLDTLHYAIEAAHDDDDGDDDDDFQHVSLKSVRLVTFLYSEKLHVLVKPHVYLNSPADLNRNANRNSDGRVGRRARVWLGPPQSGARQTAAKVLQAAGVADEDIDSIGPPRTDLTWDIAANCLLAQGDQSLVAYFRVMGVPRQTPQLNPDGEAKRLRTVCPPEGSKDAPALSIDELLQADAQIMPLPPALIDRLTEDKLYVPATIDLGTYSRLKRGVPTVGIPTVLLTNLPDSGADVVETLIRQIERGKALIEAHIDGVELDQLGRSDLIDGLHVHRGAARHMAAGRSGLIWFGLFVFGLAVAHAKRNPGSFRRGLASRSYFLVLSASLTGVWVLLSIAMMKVEGHLNPKFATMGASFQNTFQIVTRLSDDHLMTAEGEIWRWLGLLLFPVILGWLFSDVIKEVFRGSAVKLALLIRCAQVRQAPAALIAFAKCILRLLKQIIGPSPTPGPLVFLNWNRRAGRIAHELQSDAALPVPPIVVVRPESGPQNGDPDGDVRFIEGDPASRASMEKAGILDASAVTIVSAWGPADPHDRRQNVDPEYADSKTLLALLAIRALCEDGNRSSVLPIKAEIRLARNHQEARAAVKGAKLALTCLAV